MAFNTEIHWVDINPHLASGDRTPPHFYLERPLLHGDKPNNGGMYNVAEVARKGTFWTLTTPVGTGKPVWTLTSAGQFVRIPIYAYSVAMSNGAVILGAGFELAVRFTEALRQQTPVEIETLHLALHTETHNLPDNGVRLYAGVSVEVKG